MVTSAVAVGLDAKGRTLKKFRKAAQLDARIALRYLLLDVLAGSPLTPRPLRYAIYRIAGLKIRTINIFSGSRITGTDLSIGHGTFVNHDCYFDVAGGRVEIGNDCNLGPGVMLLTATHELDDAGFARESNHLTTVIEDRVWLGARATVLPGSVVESDCIVAAGAVVAGRCESGGVYGGVPARRIREVATSSG